MFDFIFLISAILFVIIDSIYLNLLKKYFTNQVTSVQGSGSTVQINFPAVMICYIFLIIGLNYFIIRPRRSVQDAFLLGLIIYSVYETTNKAIFSKWTWTTVVIDSLWGGVLFALTTFLISKIRRFV